MQLPEPEQVDHLPAVLARIATVSHAMHRLAEGLELRDVVSEFFLLRHVLLEIALRSRASSDPVAETQLVCWAVDACIRESVTAYSVARQRTLEALDRISSEALASRSLEELLPRLLGTVLEASAEVDVACLLVAEGERLVHRAAVGLDARNHEAIAVH